MNIIHIDDPAVNDLILHEFNKEFVGVVLQFNQVYALIAPSNEYGVQSLNTIKQRLANKFYSSIFGSFKNILNIHGIHLPDIFHDASAVTDFFKGSFLRFDLTDKLFDSPTVHNGTHQTYISNDNISKLVDTIYRYLPKAPNPLFNGIGFNPIICTSANLSGDTRGAITTEEEAIAFAKKRNINLFIKNDTSFSPRGSYPIFQIKNDKLHVARNINMDSFLKGKENSEFFNKVTLD